MSEYKPFEEIPLLGVVPPVLTRSISPGNPHRLMNELTKSVGPLFRIEIKCAGEGVAEHSLHQVYVYDMETANSVLLDEEGIWKKGPTTYNPFRSIVPLHLIGLEGEQHLKLRRYAQQALSHQTFSRLPRIIASQAEKLLKMKLQRIEESRIPITNLDKILRSIALDIVSEAVFGESWNAIDDYSEANVKAHNLSQLMHELHWRISEYHDQGWLNEPERYPVGRLLEPLKSFIYKRTQESRNMLSKLDAEKKLELHESDEQTMLEHWVLKGLLEGKLDENEIYNLCMTFLTMGHENIATGVAWTIINLAENPVQQEKIRKEFQRSEKKLYTPFEIKESFPVLVDSFFESMRLAPSVPVVTREPVKDTILMGYHLPKKTEVVVSLYGIHRNTDVWGNDSSDFNAERFKESKCPYVSTTGFPDAQPFSSGKRACIGQPLSLLEVHGIVGMFLKNYEISSLSEKRVRGNSFISLRPGDHKLLLKPISSGTAAL